MTTSTSTATKDIATGDPVGQLASLFDALRDGVIVAATGHRPGVIRLVVENKRALGRIADSWQRLVVTLNGCDTFRYETATPGSRLDDPKHIGARSLRIRTVTRDNDQIRIRCETPLGTGVLQVSAAAFALMLGSGRTVSASSLLQDLLSAQAA